MRLRGAAAIAAATLLLGTGSAQVAAKDSSGTITISQFQVAFLVSGNVGGGTLEFQGQSHNFSIGGLGYGGFGASKIEATGNVYNLDDIRDFEGAHVQGRIFATLPETKMPRWPMLSWTV